MKWETVRLGDVTDSCLGKMLDQEKNKGEYQPYLANLNVRWGYFELDNLSVMRFEKHEEDRYGLRYGDLIVCEGGDPGRCAIWKDIIPNMKIQKALHRVRVHDDLDYRFLYYWFLLAGKRGALEQYFTGSTIKHMPGDKLKSIIIEKPPLETQKRIADILSAYDDLIENNQKQIKLLEEAAQRLYKEWFVDLRFPGHEHTAIVDGVPEGWRKTAISELGEYINGFAFKPSDWTTNGKPIIKIKEMGSGIVQNTPRNNGARVPEKYLVKSGDILFSWSATLMVMIWDNEDGWLNQHIFKVIPSSDICREFLFQSISKAIHEFSNLTTGATMKHIQRNKLDNVFVSVPNKNIMDMFNNFSFPIRERILRLSEQTNLLKQARDRLLPKLMSGEMEV